MIKEFLTFFSLLIKMTQTLTILDDDNVTVRRTVELYPLLTEDEKNFFFDILKSFGDQGDEYRLYFEFLSLHLYKDKRYADDIVDCLLYFDMDVDRRYNYYANLGRELFVAGISADYGKCLKLEEMLVNEFREKVQSFPEYTPYEERDRGLVVVIIRPFLGEYHSPTLQTINLDSYLRRAGYRTYYISYSDNEILKKYARDIPSPFTRSILYSGTGTFEYDCFDMKIEGFHVDLGADSMSDDINMIVNLISKIAPEFVIGIEGGNIISDICTDFTDVITMNVVDDLPVTVSDSVLRYFPGEYNDSVKRAGLFNKSIYDAAYDNELMPYNDGKEQIELPSGRFHICIMGNRLDDELSEQMLDTIRNVINDIPESDMVFIGNCPKTEEKLEDIKTACHFLGYVERCEDAVGACSLFLNPPRRGGGGGGYMAIKNGVPVYTLGNCDVASCVGEEFVHGSYDELIPLVRRCLDDKEYYKSFCGIAKESFRKKYYINSMKNISNFCRKYTDHIAQHRLEPKRKVK